MTTPELIRMEIDKLHKSGKSDWRTLFEQVKPYKEIRYNTAQILAVLAAKNPQLRELDLEWGRGTGKTTVFAKFTRMIAEEMPRASFQWIVPTYKKFLTEIIPAYIHALEMQGYYKDLHYFIGRKAPSKWRWDEPYKPPVKYDNFIQFYNGFGIHLLSQDIPGSGRGLSTDGEFADEAAMLDNKAMEANSNPSIRGSNMRELGDKRWFDFRLKASSTPIEESGAWFIERENMATAAPQRHFFLGANCIENVQLGILKPDYLSEARRTAIDIEVFNAEYLNIRPRFVRGGFYALLDQQRHAYSAYKHTGFSPDAIGAPNDCRGDADLDNSLPLILGLDFGAAINSLVVGQHLPGEIRAIKNFFAKGSEGLTQDDLADAFCQYYAPFPNKEIHLHHDATGNHATGNTKLNKAEQFVGCLTGKGWRVRRFTIHGTNPRHFEKYRLFEAVLGETNTRLPRFRINRANARETWVSMSRAKAKRGSNGEIRKDKSGERVDNPNREYATDLSDALDNIMFGMFGGLMNNFGAPLPT